MLLTRLVLRFCWWAAFHALSSSASPPFLSTRAARALIVPHSLPSRCLSPCCVATSRHGNGFALGWAFVAWL